MTTQTALTAIALGLCVFSLGCGNSAEKQAAEGKAAAERKTAEERATAEKKALAEKKVDDERAAAEKLGGSDKELAATHPNRQQPYLTVGSLLDLGPMEVEVRGVAEATNAPSTPQKGMKVIEVGLKIKGHVSGKFSSLFLVLVEKSGKRYSTSSISMLAPNAEGFRKGDVLTASKIEFPDRPSAGIGVEFKVLFEVEKTVELHSLRLEYKQDK